MLVSTVPTASATTSASSGSGAGLYQLAGIAIGIIANTIASNKSKSEQQKLQAKVALLTLEQQKELAIRLQDAQSEIARMDILYKSLAMDKDRIATSALNKQKFVGISILGISFVILAIVIYKVKTKNK